MEKYCFSEYLRSVLFAISLVLGEGEQKELRKERMKEEK
jgi:hypothetical protein